MSMEQAADMKDTVGRSVLESLRAFVEQTQLPKPPKQKRESTHWSRIVVLVVAAIDISALLWGLDSLMKSPFVDLLLKAVPAVFGVTLAAYVENAGTFVRAVADRWWFRGLVAGVAAVIVVPQFWTYSLPLDVPDTAHVSLDGTTTVLTPVRDTSVRLLAVSGFRPHRLMIQEYDSSAGQVSDSFTVRQSQLLHAGLRELLFGMTPLGHYRLTASILSSVTIDHPTDAMLLEVRGEFPELFLRSAERENYVSDPGEDGLRRISFLKPEHTDQSTLRLPPGHYSIRYHTQRHCWSESDTITVVHATLGAMSLMHKRCNKDPLNP
jgi:hypothetical protein